MLFPDSLLGFQSRRFILLLLLPSYWPLARRVHSPTRQLGMNFLQPHPMVRVLWWQYEIPDLNKFDLGFICMVLHWVVLFSWSESVNQCFTACFESIFHVAALAYVTCKWAMTIFLISKISVYRSKRKVWGKYRIWKLRYLISCSGNSETKSIRNFAVCLFVFFLFFWARYRALVLA